MPVNVNFYRNNWTPNWKENFETKYGRTPKTWDIESLHELWLKVKKRSDDRNADIWNQVTRIAEMIPPNDRNEHHAYYTQNGEIRCYVVRYESYSKSLSLGNETMRFKSREEKLDFFLSTELNFQMGEELKRLKTFEGKYHWVVFSVFWEQVEEKLRKRFKDVRPESAFAIKIGSKKYIVSTENRYESYRKFKLESELEEALEI